MLVRELTLQTHSTRYASFYQLRNSSAQFDPSWPDRITINRTTSGTIHGLSKMIYWRGTRRAVGVDGFKLLHTQVGDECVSA